ncbi:MAG: glycoside hydrolase family 18 protein [Phycisphaerales bacterium]|jgi:chitinase|nr:glycoside hydrolase family 18 protein [Phycisphaerales bacterium]MBT7170694.1 glycoside hydrolase family 18 protein [Phycisphaerales bacterium]
MARSERTIRHAELAKGWFKRIAPFAWLPVLLVSLASCEWFCLPTEIATMPTVDAQVDRNAQGIVAPRSTVKSTEEPVVMLPNHTRSIRGAYWFNAEVASIPARYYTHVYHAFLRSDNNGNLLLNAASTPTASFAQTAAKFVAHVHKGGAYAMLSLGGGMDKSFHVFTPNAVKRRRYVNAVLAVVQKYGYDGVDLDWEHPRNATEKRHWAALMTDMRTGLDMLARRSDKKYWLTAAVGTSKWNAGYFDIPTIRTKLDFINLMAYDYIGPWGGDPAGDQAALATASYGGHSTYKALKHWHDLGIKADQIVIGLPFYTRACFGYKPGQIIQKNASSGKRTMAFGYDSFVAYAAQKRWTYRLDPASKVRWYRSPGGSHFAAVDGPEAIAHKTHFAESNGYRGVFCWATYHNPGQQLQKAMAREQ